MKELVIKQPGHPLTRFGLVVPEVHIGRDPSCEVVLNSDFVSRRHAVLRRHKDRYEIADLGSRNGVRVNGSTLTKAHHLKKGDEISIADCSLTFWESGEGETHDYAETTKKALLISVEKREVVVMPGGVQLALSRQEFDLLALLYLREGSVCLREQIGEAIWGSNLVQGRQLAKYDENMIHRLVARLRSKFEEQGIRDLIVNVPGVGYRLDLS